MGLNAILMNKSFFLKQFFKNFKHTGAICPSSKSLTSKMLKGIDFSKPLRIVELGPGTGCMTESILAQMHPDSELICIEINPTFCEQLKKFETDKKFNLYQASALDFTSRLNERKIDYVISGLPLANFKKHEIKSIFQEIERALTPKGKYIQFQYTLKLKQLFKANFTKVSKSFTPFNMPPAFVFRCSF
ncbi:MAG: Ornithine lipid N-methyltransferase [Chlamydiae bacterium]|nr:Ornithine lipid N-methyltransferase [Chlamydiota bacterium]